MDDGAAEAAAAAAAVGVAAAAEAEPDTGLAPAGEGWEGGGGGGSRREKRYEGGSLWRRAVEVQQDEARRSRTQDAGRSRIVAGGVSTEELGDGRRTAVQSNEGWTGCWLAAGWLGALAQTKAGLTTFRLESVSWLECRPLAALVCSVQRPNVGSSQSRDARDSGGAQLTFTPDLVFSCCRFTPPASSKGRGGGRVGRIAVAECSSLDADDSFCGRELRSRERPEMRGRGSCSSAILYCGRECGSRPEEEVGWWRRRGGEEADHEGKTREDAEESFFRLNYCVECYISVEKQTKTRQPEPIGCCRAVGGIWAMGSAVLARPAGFPLQQSVGHAEGGSPGFSSSLGFSAADRMFGGFGHGDEGQPRRCRLTDEAPQIANCKCSQPA